MRPGPTGARPGIEVPKRNRYLLGVQLQELMEAEDDRHVQARLQETRAQAQAELAQLREKETAEQ